MPELPEVETIKRQLAQKIIGKKLNSGEVIKRVRRRAKILIIDLDDNSSLIFHLKLTGQLIFDGQPSKHTRKVFNFKDGHRLIFNNVRKFGWWKRVKDIKKIEEEFGPEPLTLSFKTFKKLLLKRSRSKIKPLLMNQKFIAGIGNIYSDEILFEAKIHPERLVKNLKPNEIESIFKAIKKILKAAIKHQGSSLRNYLNAYGQKGSYGQYHQAYHQINCSRCKTKIKKIKLAGRSAHFCPKCQTL